MTQSDIRSRLDGLAPGEAASFSGAVTLDRPLQLGRDRAALRGLPRGLLRTTGAFPALILAPPTRRYPGFPARHRVQIPGGDGTLPVGLDLSDARLTLRATAFERIPQGASKLTVAALLARKGTSLGNNDTAPILCTDTERYGCDPIRLLVDSTRVMLDFRTEDGATHRAWFRRPASDRLGLVVLIDGEAGKVAAFADGEPLAPTTDPRLAPGSRLARGDGPNLTVGWDPNSGQGSYVLGGLRVCARLVAPVDSPRLQGTEAALYGPSPNGSDASLDLGVPMEDDSDWAVWYRVRGSRLGCGVLVPAAWSPWDAVQRLEVRDLDVEVGDKDYGQGIWSGPCLRLKLRDVTMTGGARGFDQHPQIVSYRSSLTGLSFYQNSEVALCVGNGIVRVSDAHFDPSPRLAHVRWHSAGGELSDFFVSEGEAPVIIDVRSFSGQFAIRDGEMNREAKGPDCYVRVRRAQVGRGRVGVLAIEKVEAGNAPPGVAVVDVDDSVWKGRTDVGTIRVDVRDSFTLLPPDVPRFRGLSGAVAAAVDGVEVTTTTDPTSTVP